MADMDKVLKGLEMCKIDFCDECPYDDEASCTFYLKHDALELIDTQYKLIRELQNLISAVTKMLKGR